MPYVYLPKSEMTTMKQKGTKKKTTRKGKGFSIGGAKFLGIETPSLGVSWKKPTRARASRGLSSAKPYRNASAFMSRNMRYGQSFNTGAVSMGMDNGVVHVKHREFLGVINSSIDFQPTLYDINPGLSRLMPWCSAIANNFQQYKIQSMAFEFVSTSATALVSGTNTALGQISIATQYDSLQPDFRNLNDMLNSQWATSTKISSDLLHPIESQRNQTTASPLYTRSGRAPGDLRLYDWGKTTIAVYGCQSTGDQIGQIWVSYDICFYKPITYNLDGGNAETAFLTLVDGFSQARPIGLTTRVNYDNIGLEVDQLSATQSIRFPPGSSAYYFVEVAFFGSATATGTSRVGNITLSGANFMDSLYNQYDAGSQLQRYAGSVEASYVGSASNRFNFTFIINIIDPNVGAVINFPPGVTWQPVQAMMTSPRDVCNVVISQLNIGISQFVHPETVIQSGCCDEIEELRRRITELETKEAESEAESEEESQHSHERDDVELKILEVSPPNPDPTVEEQRQMLLKYLRQLDEAKLV